MTSTELIKELQEQRQSADALVELWTELLPAESLPTKRQFIQWLRMYGGLETVMKGVEQAAKLYNRKQQALTKIEHPTEKQKAKLDMDNIQLIEYASATMRNIRDGISRYADDDDNETDERAPER